MNIPPAQGYRAVNTFRWLISSNLSLCGGHPWQYMTIQMKAKSELYFPVVFSINMFEKCFWWVFRRRILKYNYVDWKLEFRIGVHRPKYAPEAFLCLDYARHSAHMGIRVCIWVCDHSDESYHDLLSNSFRWYYIFFCSFVSDFWDLINDMLNSVTTRMKQCTEIKLAVLQFPGYAIM